MHVYCICVYNRNVCFFVCCIIVHSHNTCKQYKQIQLHTQMETSWFETKEKYTLKPKKNMKISVVIDVGNTTNVVHSIFDVIGSQFLQFSVFKLFIFALCSSRIWQKQISREFIYLFSLNLFFVFGLNVLFAFILLIELYVFLFNTYFDYNLSTIQFHSVFISHFCLHLFCQSNCLLSGICLSMREMNEIRERERKS